MKKIRWGIFSTAKIGVVKVIPAMQRGQFCEMNAIASRTRQKAEDMAEQLSIPKAYDSYEALLKDPDIDAIYNPLPNHLHVPWSIKSLEAGKHVLCEKPIALSVEEAEHLLKISKQYPELKIMEAFMYRFHPQWLKAKEWVNNGQIGQLQTIHSFFSYYNMDPDNIRNKADIGGGGLMDIGCYNISLSRFIFDSEPEAVTGRVNIDPQFKTDRLVSGILEFETGTSSFTCATQISNYQSVHIFGSAGRIEIEIPFNAPNDRPCKIWLQTSKGVKEETVDICDQYTLQGDLFSKAILDDTDVPTPLEDAVANMRVIEAINQSSKMKCRIDLRG
ncbi:Gfo/Idh/MocA family protein [bacterium]